MKYFEEKIQDISRINCKDNFSETILIVHVHGRKINHYFLSLTSLDSANYPDIFKVINYDTTKLITTFVLVPHFMFVLMISNIQPYKLGWFLCILYVIVNNIF